MPQCTAKSKQTQQRCGRMAMKGKTKCYMHGGKSLSGVASPSFKHGRYSDNLPTNMQASYEAAREDERLLMLTDEIALTDAAMHAALGKLPTGESGAAWQTLGALMDQFNRCMQKRDEAGMAAVFSEIQDTIKVGIGAEATWQEIHRLIMQRKVLVESERKRELELGQLVSMKEISGVLAILMGVLKLRIPDRTLLGEIVNDLNVQILQRSPREPRQLSGRTLDGDWSDPAD